MSLDKLFLYENFDFLHRRRSILRNSRLEANSIVFWIQLILSLQLSNFVFFIQIFSRFRLFNCLISKSSIREFYIKRWLHDNWSEWLMIWTNVWCFDTRSAARNDDATVVFSFHWNWRTKNFNVKYLLHEIIDLTHFCSVEKRLMSFIIWLISIFIICCDASR